eukprot:scpid26424/ scgid12930/ 
MQRHCLHRCIQPDVLRSHEHQQQWQRHSLPPRQDVLQDPLSDMAHVSWRSVSLWITMSKVSSRSTYLLYVWFSLDSNLLLQHATTGRADVALRLHANYCWRPEHRRVDAVPLQRWALAQYSSYEPCTVLKVCSSVHLESLLVRLHLSANLPTSTAQ